GASVPPSACSPGGYIAVPKYHESPNQPRSSASFVNTTCVYGSSAPSAGLDSGSWMRSHAPYATIAVSSTPAIAIEATEGRAAGSDMRVPGRMRGHGGWGTNLD